MLRIEGTLSLLLVEDNPGDAELTRRALRLVAADWIEVTTVARLAEGRAHILGHGTDAILLDLNLPDSVGLETVRGIREVDRTLPLVVLSGEEADDLAHACVEAGAYAVLVKEWITAGSAGIGARLLERTILHSIDDAAKRVELERLNLALSEMNAQLEHQARLDPLTGLLNRRGLEGELDRIRRSTVRNHGRLCVGLVDCDDFKSFNQRLGHSGGDRVLTHVTHLLQTSLRPNDVVARVGGDEFLILLPGVDIFAGFDIAERTRRRIAASPCTNEGEPIQTTVSIGLAELTPATGPMTIGAMLEGTRDGLAACKSHGKNTVRAVGFGANGVPI